MGAVFQESFSSSTRRSLSKHHATPVLRRPDRHQSALALAAILIAEHARLPQAIAAQTVRAKQPRQLFIDGADRLLVCDRRPNQPVHILHRLDLYLDDTHPNFTIPTTGVIIMIIKIVYNTVVLEPNLRPHRSRRVQHRKPRRIMLHLLGHLCSTTSQLLHGLLQARAQLRCVLRRAPDRVP